MSLTSALAAITDSRAAAQRDRERRRRWEASDRTRNVEHIDCVHERVTVALDFPRFDPERAETSLAALVATDTLRDAATAARDRAVLRGTGYRPTDADPVRLRARFASHADDAPEVDGSVSLCFHNGPVRDVALFDPACEWLDGQPWNPIWDVMAAFVGDHPSCTILLDWDCSDQLRLHLSERHPMRMFVTWDIEMPFGFADDAAESVLD